MAEQTVAPVQAEAWYQTKWFKSLIGAVVTCLAAVSVYVGNAAPPAPAPAVVAAQTAPQAPLPAVPPPAVLAEKISTTEAGLVRVEQKIDVLGSDITDIKVGLARLQERQLGKTLIEGTVAPTLPAATVRNPPVR